MNDNQTIRRLMCGTMRQGNCLYDRRGLCSLLSMDEVIDLFPSVGVTMCGESFIRFSSLSSVIDLLRPSDPEAVCGGVLVITPYSFGVVCTTTTFFLFDSHSHGDQGALFSKVPVSEVAFYLRSFFTSYYRHLNCNDTSGANNAAHLTSLSVG